MPSIILDTGFETYRLTSSNSEPWQSAPYLHSPLQVIKFILNTLLYFTIELSHYLCGKLDRGLKVERLNLPSASRMFSYISNLSLATNLGSLSVSVENNGNSDRICIGCTSEEGNPEIPGLNSYFCKNCCKKSVESTLFQALMKFNNRIHSAKSSRGMHGLLSYSKQRQLLEFPTVKVSEYFESKCDSATCPFCVQDYEVEYTLDPALYDELISRLSYLTDRVSSCAISRQDARGFINWVDSSFGAFNSVLETESSSQQQ